MFCMFRTSHDLLPVPARIISDYYGIFLDSRDRNIEGGCRGLVLTHIYLLAGIAIPVWVWAAMLLLSSNASPLTARLLVQPKSYLLLKHLGWLTVGVGDSVVSVQHTIFEPHLIVTSLTVYGLIVSLHFVTTQGAVVGSRCAPHRKITWTAALRTAGLLPRTEFESLGTRNSVLDNRSLQGSAACLLSMLLGERGANKCNKII